jgi:hypothetical protein
MREEDGAFVVQAKVGRVCYFVDITAMTQSEDLCVRWAVNSFQGHATRHSEDKEESTAMKNAA